MTDVRRVAVGPVELHVELSGPPTAPPVLFVHGNLVSGRFYRELVGRLGDGVRSVVVDLRGYGRSGFAPIDATRGVRDLSDDLARLLDTLGIGPVTVVGWSLGGNVAMQLAIDHPRHVAALLLEAPGSPYGYGGTKDVDGTLCWPDAAGSGGGAVNRELVARLAAGDRSDDPVSPRTTMRSFFFAPGFHLDPEREEAYLDAILQIRVGEDAYPGDARPSPNWPGFAPGRRGPINALSPAYLDQSAIASIDTAVPLVWVRGDQDLIVSDRGSLDLGVLGEMGLVPGWPGPDVYPPQPMVSQTRAVLSRFSDRGGDVAEVVLEGVGHSPHIEAEDTFAEIVVDLARRVS